MRKVRDYDAELNALRDKAKAIKARKVEQLGALVVATGADALALWKRRGKRAFDAEASEAASSDDTPCGED